MKFGIVCDSACDLTAEEIHGCRVAEVPFYVSLDGNSYLKENVEITATQLYAHMRDNPDCYPKTSMPTIPDFGEAFAKVLDQGLDVLCITLTEKFSGSYQAALNAKQMMEAEDPSRHIHVLDSQLVTALEGLLVTEAVRLRDMDCSLDEAVTRLEEVRGTGHILFTTRDLQYLHHGGRLGSAQYVAGSMLDIKPVLHFHRGDLEVAGVCRGQKRSLRKLVDSAIDQIQKEKLDVSEYLFGTGRGTDFDGYDEFVELLKSKMDAAGLRPAGWVNIRIGATIGVHTGPYPVGLGFLRRCRD